MKNNQLIKRRQEKKSERVKKKIIKEIEGKNITSRSE